MIIFLMSDLVLVQPLVYVAYDAVSLFGLDSRFFPKIEDGLGCFTNRAGFCEVELLVIIPKM